MFLLFARGNQHPSQEDQEHGCGGEGHYQHRVNLQALGGDMDHALPVLGTHAPDEHPMAVDSVRRAGDKGAVITVFDDLQLVQLLGFHNAYLIHLIGQGLIEDMEHKRLALGHFIQIGQQSRAGEAPVPGQHAVGRRPPYRKRCPVQMSHGDLQHAVLRAVVHREADADFRNLNITHDAGFRHVQQGFIDCPFLLRQVDGVPPGRTQVERLRLRPQPVIVRLRHHGNAFGIAGNGPGLMERIPIITDGRIQQQRQTHRHHAQQKNGR